jgi:hypothetical protein
MKDRDEDREPTLFELLHRYLAVRAASRRGREEPRRGPPPRRPRRGLEGGGEPVSADPKPRPTLLTGGAEVPVE